MKKLHLLRSPDDFRRVLRRGRDIKSPLFRVIFVSRNFGSARFGFFVSRFLDKRAFVRNRLRRRAREWIRRQARLLKMPKDVIIIFKKEAIQAERRKFYEELAKIFERLGHQ